MSHALRRLLPLPLLLASACGGDPTPRPIVLFELDPAFGTNGVVAHDDAAGGHGYDVGLALAFDAVGRVVLAGRSQSAADVSGDLDVERFMATGGLDTNFGGTGFVTRGPLAAGDDAQGASDVAIDANGRIVLSGWAWNPVGHNDFLACRLQSNGDPDSTFGTDGCLVLDGVAGGANQDYGNGVAVDAAGRLVFVGASSKANGIMSAFVMRRLESGEPDPSFGGDGVVFLEGLAGGSSGDEASAFALDAQGRIVVVGGSVNAAGNYDVFVARLLDDGSLDASFGMGGVFVHAGPDGGHGTDWGTALTFDAAHRVLVAGYSTDAFDTEAATLYRLKANGALDASFGGTGFVRIASDPSGAGWSYGNAVVVTDGGDAFLGGSASLDGADDGRMEVWAFDASGAPAPRLAGAAELVVDDPFGVDGDDEVSAMGIAPDGSLFLGGRTTGATGTRDVALVHLVPVSP